MVLGVTYISADSPTLQRTGAVPSSPGKLCMFIIYKYIIGIEVSKKRFILF